MQLLGSGFHSVIFKLSGADSQDNLFWSFLQFLLHKSISTIYSGLLKKHSESAILCWVLNGTIQFGLRQFNRISFCRPFKEAIILQGNFIRVLKQRKIRKNLKKGTFVLVRKVFDHHTLPNSLVEGRIHDLPNEYLTYWRCEAEENVRSLP